MKRAVLAMGLMACGPSVDVSTDPPDEAGETDGDASESASEGHDPTSADGDESSDGGGSSDDGGSSGDDTTDDEVPQWCTVHAPVPQGEFANSVFIHDNDVDGRPELWAVDHGEVESTLYRFSMGADRSLSELDAGSVSGRFYAWGDLDGDGRLDAISEPEPDVLVARYAAAGGAIEGPETAVTGAVGRPRLVADLTGDGRADLLGLEFLEDYTPAIRVQPGDGDGTFAEGALAGLGEIEVVDPFEVHTTDVPRTIVAQYGEWCDFCDPAAYVVVYGVEDDGSLVEQRRSDDQRSYTYLQGIDHDGDGQLDVLVHDRESGDVVWLESTPTGFDEVVAVQNIQLLVGTDFDLDGFVDLLVLDEDTQFVHWGTAEGFGEPQAVAGDAIGVGPEPRGDLDGDGFVDLGGWDLGPVIWTLVPCED